MMARVFTFLALLASAAAFAPVNSPASFVARETSLSMAKTSDIQSKIMAAAAGVVPAIMTASAAVATEGTSEWFGVDDQRLLGVLFIGHWFVLTLWWREYGDDVT